MLADENDVLSSKRERESKRFVKSGLGFMPFHCNYFLSLFLCLFVASANLAELSLLNSHYVKDELRALLVVIYAKKRDWR
jgi:hypothetical protein